MFGEIVGRLIRVIGGGALFALAVGALFYLVLSVVRLAHDGQAVLP